MSWVFPTGTTFLPSGKRAGTFLSRHLELNLNHHFHYWILCHLMIAMFENVDGDFFSYSKTLVKRWLEVNASI